MGPIDLRLDGDLVGLADIALQPVHVLFVGLLLKIPRHLSAQDNPPVFNRHFDGVLWHGRIPRQPVDRGRRDLLVAVGSDGGQDDWISSATPLTPLTPLTRAAALC